MNQDTLTIEAIRQGDTESYGTLVQRYQRMVYGILWSRLGHRDLCEDAVQETFIQGFRFLGALRKPEKFPAWIAQIARNIASSFWRRHRRELAQLHRWRLEEPPAPQRDDHDVTEDQPIGEMLSHALAELPEIQRECLVLFYIEDKSLREGARLLGITENALRARLHRARGSLRGKMEEQLQRSLRRLRPREDLPRRVLAAIPAMPIGWAGGLSLAPLFPTLQMILLNLLSRAPFFLFLGWVNWRLAKNYRPGEEFRRAIVRKNFLKLVLAVVPVVAVATVVAPKWGFPTLSVLLGIYLIPALTQAFLFLRVNRTGLAIANTVGVAAMFSAFAAMGLWERPFVWFVIAMLVYNIALWMSRKSMPSRLDYNLFLRAAKGGLDKPQAREQVHLNITPQEMRAFARLLGGMFLINDYSHRRRGWVLYLPPAGSDFVSTFLISVQRFAGVSRVFVAPDGSCRARLSTRDRRHLSALAPREERRPEELEQAVASVTRAALARFLSGDREGAARLLQAKPDEAVFVRPVHQLTSQKVLYVVAIGACLFLLIMYLLFLKL